MLKEILQTVRSGKPWLVASGHADHLFGMFAQGDKHAELGQSAKQPVFDAQFDSDLLSAVAGVTASAPLIGPWQMSYGDVPEGSIVIIPLQGILLKYSNWYGYGTSTIAKWISAAGANSNVIGIMVLGDTPGGSTAGIRSAYDAITEVKKIKPVGMFVDDGILGSGGYWIAAACNFIYSSHSTNTIGSIGVMVTLVNSDKNEELQGYKVINIFAEGSENKNSEFYQALEGKEAAIKMKLLNPLREQFIADVKAGRPNLKKSESGEDPLNGGIFGDESVVEMGLVDKICSMADALDEIEKLSKSSLTKPKSSMKIKLNAEKHSVLITAMGLTLAAGATEIEAEDFDVNLASASIAANAAAASADGLKKVNEALEEFKTASKATSDDSKATNEKVTAIGAKLAEIEANVKTIGESSGVILRSKAEDGDGGLGDENTRPKGTLLPRRRN